MNIFWGVARAHNTPYSILSVCIDGKCKQKQKNRIFPSSSSKKSSKFWVFYSVVLMTTTESIFVDEFFKGGKTIWRYKKVLGSYKEGEKHGYLAYVSEIYPIISDNCCAKDNELYPLMLSQK